MDARAAAGMSARRGLQAAWNGHPLVGFSADDLRLRTTIVRAGVMIRPMALPQWATSPRIDLRPAQPSDAALLKHWREEASVRRYQPLGDVTLGQLRADLAQQSAADLRRGRGQKFQWLILVGEQPAGWVTLVIANWEHGLAEIGYALSTPYQRRGVMVPALRQLIAELFATTPLSRIEARCSVENLASQRVLDRTGFNREGLLRGYFVLGGRRVDNYLYAILRGDRANP